VGLARGYLDRPALTAERFLPDPFSSTPGARMYRTGDLCRYRGDGNLEFLGRIDHQVKLRGHRIELGEIEAVLGAHPAVKSCVVVARPDARGEKRLIAYLVPREEAPGQAELRGHLQSKLPDYMLPSAFVALSSLPLSPNGKVDRKALPAPEPGPERAGAGTPPRTRTEQGLLRIWEELLATRPIGVRDDFFSLGGHSLLAVRLLARVQAAFGRAVSLAQLFQAPTIEALASLLDGGAPATPGAPDLWAESVLEPDISCEGALPVREGEPSRILLTGATGFLGAFLLSELLEQTSASILCLVRSKTTEEARARLQEVLTSYSLWRGELQERVIPVPGDLARPRLGLPPEVFERLAGEVDVIYHNGALVNFSYPYTALKASNVEGTREILRLACRARVKPVHYVSTLSVFPLQRGPVHLEEEELERPELLHGGYSQSKWVAERLALLARRRGLPVTIYRPGRVTGHSKTGTFNQYDIFCHMLRACIQIGKIPDDDSQVIDMTPVDFASRAIVHISRSLQSARETYHIRNPASMQLKELTDTLLKNGYAISTIPYDEWISQLEQAASRDTTEPIFQILLDIFNGVSLQEIRFDPEVDCRNASEKLKGTNISCPPADGALLSIYIEYLVERGVLPAPRLVEKMKSNGSLSRGGTK
jgi:myxalamid-type nonribosomal peptide synthetase MxaA